MSERRRLAGRGRPTQMVDSGCKKTATQMFPAQKSQSAYSGAASRLHWRQCRRGDDEFTNAHHIAIRHSTAQRSSAQRSTAQCSTAQRSTAQRSTAQRNIVTNHGIAQHSTAQHDTAQHSTVQHEQHSTAQHSTESHCTTGGVTADRGRATTACESPRCRLGGSMVARYCCDHTTGDLLEQGRPLHSG